MSTRRKTLGFTIPDIMQMAKISRQTAYNEINSGRLKSYKIGSLRRVSPEAANDWIAQLESESQKGE